MIARAVMAGVEVVTSHCENLPAAEEEADEEKVVEVVVDGDDGRKGYVTPTRMGKRV
jgi:hypothetical protein